MEKNKYSKILTSALVVIIIGILGTLGYFGYGLLNENNTKKKYTEAAEQFEQKVLGGSSSVSSGGNTSNISINALNRTSDRNRDKQYMGDKYKYEIVGTIDIPKTKLKCAILNETTGDSLELAVTVMYPPASDVNVPGRNVILYGHNYRNSLFFSKNAQLVNGDKIYILDKDGRKVTYEVYETFETSSTDTTFYNKVSDENKCEVTLSTCTDDANTTDRRIIVRAREI